MTPHSVDEPSAQSRQDLDRTLFHGLAWTALGRWIAQVISWGATLYVARILTPGDYGLVAMATIPIGLARLIEGIGLDVILLQDRSLNKEQFQRLAGASASSCPSILGGSTDLCGNYPAAIRRPTSRAVLTRSTTVKEDPPAALDLRS